MVQPAPRIRKDPVVKSARRVGSPSAIVEKDAAVVEVAEAVFIMGAAAMAVLQQHGQRRSMVPMGLSARARCA